MKSSYLVSYQNKDVRNDMEYINTNSDKTYLNCVIADDAPKKLDFLLLVIETLQINATESIVLKAKTFGLSQEFSNRVQFWKMRTCNPLRKSFTFSKLTSNQIDSFVSLISAMAENLYPLIRQLLSSKESKTMNQERWLLFTSRLKSLIRERMNLQRTYITTILDDENNDFFRELLVILSISCGPGGSERLKASMYHKI